jgi:hypothetical protein
MRAISIIIFLSIINFISAQNLTVELSGQLKNRETGKNINVIVKKNGELLMETITSRSGKYTLSVPVKVDDKRSIH